MTGSNLVRGIGVSRAVSIHDKKAERGHWRENQYRVGWLELTCLGLATQLRSWPACQPDDNKDVLISPLTSPLSPQQTCPVSQPAAVASLSEPELGQLPSSAW